jgi:hypothetical protein
MDRQAHEAKAESLSTSGLVSLGYSSAYHDIPGCEVHSLPACTACVFVLRPRLRLTDRGWQYNLNPGRPLHLLEYNQMNLGIICIDTHVILDLYEKKGPPQR